MKGGGLFLSMSNLRDSAIFVTKERCQTIGFKSLVIRIVGEASL